MIGKRFAVAFVLLALLACSSTSSQDAPLPDLSKKVEDPAKARVYIFRENIPFSKQDALRVDIDQRRVGFLARSTYLVLEIEPGDHSIWMTLDRSLAATIKGIDKLDLKPNQVYYYEVQFPIERDRRPKLVELATPDAEIRLKSMKLAGSD
jgi:hypothetical protein